MRPDLRWLVCASVMVLPASAAAQTVIFGPDPLPLAPGIGDAPMGAWSEYRITTGKEPPEELRVVLVGRDDTSVTLEFRSRLPDGGPLGRSTKKVTVLLRVPRKPGYKGAANALIQVDGQLPMKVPATSSEQGFAAPSPKTMVEETTIKVAAGQFKAKHYRHRDPDFDEAEHLWVCAAVYPLGLVKSSRPDFVLGLETPNTVSEPSLFAWPVGQRWELTATGVNGKRTITTRSRAFDATILEMELMGAESGPVKAAGPPVGK